MDRSLPLYSAAKNQFYWGYLNASPSYWPIFSRRLPQRDGEIFRMWSRIHSIAREAELWMSLVVNGWLLLRAAVFLNRKMGSLIPLIATGLFAAPVLFAATLVAMIVSMFDSAAIDWYYGLAIAGTSVSLVGIALTEVERLRCRMRTPHGRANGEAG
jgi:hypothetical protein